jgi:hypothetical protein
MRYVHNLTTGADGEPVHLWQQGKGSALGLEPRDDTECVAPFGLVRSRAVSTGAVRITMTGPLLRHGDRAPDMPDPQHVAFATDDISSGSGVEVGVLACEDAPARRAVRP